MKEIDHRIKLPALMSEGCDPVNYERLFHDIMIKLDDEPKDDVVSVAMTVLSTVIINFMDISNKKKRQKSLMHFFDKINEAIEKYLERNPKSEK